PGRVGYLPNKRMTVLTALGSKNMPMMKPLTASDRSLDRTPSSPAKIEMTLQTGTIQPGLTDAIVQPMTPETRAITLQARKTGLGSLKNSPSLDGSVNNLFQIDALVFRVLFAIVHLSMRSV
ncbi:hypothetical protein KAH43_07180, partial [Candidatus Bipolaricaulota bacterium]|nr:hypothetical protein [Candidatus Bipolaricaulota bacterium]